MACGSSRCQQWVSVDVQCVFGGTVGISNRAGGQSPLGRIQGGQKFTETASLCFAEVRELSAGLHLWTHLVKGQSVLSEALARRALCAQCCFGAGACQSIGLHCSGCGMFWRLHPFSAEFWEPVAGSSASCRFWMCVSWRLSLCPPGVGDRFW